MKFSPLFLISLVCSFCHVLNGRPVFPMYIYVGIPHILISILRLIHIYWISSSLFVDGSLVCSLSYTLIFSSVFLNNLVIVRTASRSR
jgi:hypothetical protein